MTLALAALLLFALTAFLLWRAIAKVWHLLIIALLAAAVFPWVAEHLTGDVSRYLPAGTFAEGADGKDQIVIASAAATILVAIDLGAVLWGAALYTWRCLRTR